MCGRDSALKSCAREKTSESDDNLVDLIKTVFSTPLHKELKSTFPYLRSTRDLPRHRSIKTHTMRTLRSYFGRHLAIVLWIGRYTQQAPSIKITVREEDMRDAFGVLPSVVLVGRSDACTDSCIVNAEDVVAHLLPPSSSRRTSRIQCAILKLTSCRLEVA